MEELEPGEKHLRSLLGEVLEELLGLGEDVPFDDRLQLLHYFFDETFVKQLRHSADSFHIDA